MPIFEDTKSVSFTQEQASTHIAALVAHSKRMERKLTHHDMRINELFQNGDLDSLQEAQKLYHIKKERRNKIVAMQNEIKRFREIFGDEVISHK